MPLLTETKRLLAKRRRRASLTEIAHQSGGLVDYEWLKKFAAGDIEDPGVLRTERLKQALELQCEDETKERK